MERVNLFCDSTGNASCINYISKYDTFEVKIVNVSAEISAIILIIYTESVQDGSNKSDKK